ncbi:hypothetical protein PGB90_007455 [Kerria lacca]
MIRVLESNTYQIFIFYFLLTSLPSSTFNLEDDKNLFFKTFLNKFFFLIKITTSMMNYHS